MQLSYGKDITCTTRTAIKVIDFVKSQGEEIRFSSEDGFPSDLIGLLTVYSAVDKVGVDSGIADIVGVATLSEVSKLVGTRKLHSVLFCDLDVGAKYPSWEYPSRSCFGCALRIDLFAVILE